ncbi:hypothetical protein D3C73_389300 [compost metagenome]
MVRPRLSPWITSPAMAKGRPRMAAARVMSPAFKASRTALDDSFRPEASSTRSVTETVKPRVSP